MGGASSLGATRHVDHRHRFDLGPQHAPLTTPGSVSLNAATDPQAGRVPIQGCGAMVQSSRKGSGTAVVVLLGLVWVFIGAISEVEVVAGKAVSTAAEEGIPERGAPSDTSRPWPGRGGPVEFLPPLPQPSARQSPKRCSGCRSARGG